MTCVPHDTGTSRDGHQEMAAMVISANIMFSSSNLGHRVELSTLKMDQMSHYLVLTVPVKYRQGQKGICLNFDLLR